MANLDRAPEHDGPLDDLTEDAQELFTDPVAAVAKTVWWLILIRGIAAIVFGVLAILAPAVALLGIVFVFAAYAIVDGIAGIAHAIRVRDRDSRWGWLLAQGIVTVLAGLAAAIFPSLAGLLGGLVAIWTIAIYSIIAGAFGIPAAATMTADGGRKALAIVSAVLSLVLGVILIVAILVTPGATVLSFVWIVGVYAVLLGVMLIGLAVQARSVVMKG
jgi:uncharacterized membrane protein HdeD (DUF308 family)